MSLVNTVEFVENPEPRCPVILLLDTSGSMVGKPIAALNEGLQTFKNEVLQDNLASKRVEVAIVTFDSTVRVVQDFVTVDHFHPPTLTTTGATYTASGITKALDLLQERKRQYKINAITYYRPWVFLITDGGSSEDKYLITQAAQRIRQEEANKRVAFFAVGVEGANMAELQELSVRSPLQLKGLNFKEMFVWLSTSLGKVSQSTTDEMVPLSPPSWGVV